MAFGAFAECCALGSRPRGCLLLTAARLQKFWSSQRVPKPRTERAFLLWLEEAPAAEAPHLNQTNASRRPWWSPPCGSLAFGRLRQLASLVMLHGAVAIHKHGCKF